MIENIMNYRLGLDLGTNSIGWALLNITDKECPQLVDSGVRVFSDGRMPAKGGPIGEPRAVERRDARAARRQRDRRKRRQRLVLNELIRSGYVSRDSEDRRAWLHGKVSEDQGYSVKARNLGNRAFTYIMNLLGKPEPRKSKDTEGIQASNPYLLRAAALDRELSKHELGRVLMHLAIHRGFKSNRKADIADSDLSRQDQKIMNLRLEIDRLGYRTLGKFLWARHQAGDPVRFRSGQSDCYPDRQMYHDEFELIRSEQERYHPDLNWNRLEELIYYQRPLHPQERGRCRFYPDEYRTFIDTPSFTRFRYLQEVRNLRYIDSHGQELPLSPDQDNQVRAVLEKQKTVSFKKIRGIVGTSKKFNLEDERRDKIEGNKIGIEMKKALGGRWDSLSLLQQDEVVEAMYMSESDSDLIDSLRGKFSDDQPSDLEVEAVTKVTLSRRTASVSARFARACVDVMESDGVTLTEAKHRLGIDDSQSEMDGSCTELPYYGEVLPNSTVNRRPQAEPPDKNDLAALEEHWGKVTNVTVHIALNQLRQIVNALIRRYGKPTEIVVELGRNLKLPKSVVEDIVKEQSRNQKENERIKEELKTFGIDAPSRDDILKYKLWEELGTDNISRTCVYCGRTIGQHQLYSGEIEIEHILPKSRTLLNGRTNLTVAHKSCNNVKGDRTPYEAFHTNPPGFNYSKILMRANRAFDGKKRGNFSSEALENIPEVGAFLDRQVTDNCYIARLATQYLSAICPPNKVWGTTGRLTAMARRQWGFDKILTHPETNTAEAVKNRADHRHHALDAIVTACLHRGIIQQVATLSARRSYGREKFHYKFPEAPVSRDSVEAALRRIVPSIRQVHSVSGKLFEETAMGKHSFPLIPDSRRSFDVSEVSKRLWGYRKPITNLSLNDIQERVVDTALRNALLAHIQKYNTQTLKEVLAEFGEKTGIRRVRIISDKQAVNKIQSAPNKGYKSSDLLCCVIWKTRGSRGQKGQRYEPIYWTRTEALADPRLVGKRPHHENRPDPTAKKLHTLFKGDVLRLSNNEANVFVTIRGYSATDGRIDIRPAHASLSVLSWLEETNPKITEWPIVLRRKSSAKNYVSVNVIYQKFRVSKVVITPDGVIHGR